MCIKNLKQIQNIEKSPEGIKITLESGGGSNA